MITDDPDTITAAQVHRHLDEITEVDHAIQRHRHRDLADRPDRAPARDRRSDTR
ncbi:hypothetical protein ACVH9Z_23880 [Rhodococcus opacus]|uniref:Uncharacterized protein n=1 Tax=Rhodococcus opacus TaxID=37919 RepID=A0AAX3Y823_RHOOP|nr:MULTISPECIES: hypothetical protein [Rhodococcus]NHU49127.1 hypothetical protein [Rhodococcus sp. A14]MBA8964480.1 hypothetical protein [Rhodococcus opacus]MBP2207557.1 hypothetical protein [Rhodococcus opacus]MCZ4589419.1 hypothetical protein [Rhodococcus opacus]MDI9939559.1 hypothetical protein [Rhodococcus sp. IEGM 1351]